MGRLCSALVDLAVGPKHAVHGRDRGEVASLSRRESPRSGREKGRRTAASAAHRGARRPPVLRAHSPVTRAGGAVRAPAGQGPVVGGPGAPRCPAGRSGPNEGLQLAKSKHRQERACAFPAMSSASLCLARSSSSRSSRLLGYHQATRPRQRRVVRLLRGDRHLLPLHRGMDGGLDGERRARRGVHHQSSD